MAMADGFLNAIANHGGTLITYIGLVDGTGTEITGGNYTRQAATWSATSTGKISLSSDLTFGVPAGKTIAGWRGFNAETGGTNYGGNDLSQEPFSNDGYYILLASSTFITISGT